MKSMMAPEESGWRRAEEFLRVGRKLEQRDTSTMGLALVDEVMGQ